MLRDLLAETAGRLGARGEAELLLMHALQVDRAWLFAHATDAVDPGAAAILEGLVERRAQGEPVAYILGRRGFWNLDLRVTPDTLIPRPDTELLVELALERMPADAALSVADLGTGSGAVALALARERPRARVLATDASPKALDVARGNARVHGLGHVRFARGNWCEALGRERFDLIVSNPPYIESADPHLEQGDLRFEPRDALESGADGLDAIRKIAPGAIEHLVSGGWLLLEHGWRQGDAVRTVLSDSGYRETFTARDLESRDRVSGGRMPASG